MSHLCWKAVHRPGLMSEHSKLKRQCLNYMGEIWLYCNVSEAHVSFCDVAEVEPFSSLFIHVFRMEAERQEKIWVWAPQISRGAAVTAIAGRVGKEGIGHLLCFLMSNPWPFFYFPGEHSNCRILAYAQLHAKEIFPSKIEKISN